jgi:hypothetical protein
VFLAGRGPNWTLSGLVRGSLSESDDRRREREGSRELPVASLRGGVGRYNELSPADENEVAVFGRWAVNAGAGDDAASRIKNDGMDSVTSGR